MFPKLLISLCFLSLSISTYSQSLIGNWKRVKPLIKFKGTIIKVTENWGDLEIRKDSTFHIEGDSASKNSTIPGWHAGGESNGTWELRNDHLLTLYMAPKEGKIFLCYKIIILNNERLVLRSSFNKNTKEDITYLRR